MHNYFPYRIIYASRTFTQLQQVAHEVRKTAFVPRTVLLGSREKLCINTELGNLSNMMRTQACKKMNLDCKYRSEKHKEPLLPHESYDIEELHEIGKNLKVCPYY